MKLKFALSITLFSLLCLGHAHAQSVSVNDSNLISRLTALSTDPLYKAGLAMYQAQKNEAISLGKLMSCPAREAQLHVDNLHLLRRNLSYVGSRNASASDNITLLSVEEQVESLLLNQYAITPPNVSQIHFVNVTQPVPVLQNSLAPMFLAPNFRQVVTVNLDKAPDILAASNSIPPVKHVTLVVASMSGTDLIVLAKPGLVIDQILTYGTSDIHVVASSNAPAVTRILSIFPLPVPMLPSPTDSGVNPDSVVNKALLQHLLPCAPLKSVQNVTFPTNTANILVGY